MSPRYSSFTSASQLNNRWRLRAQTRPFYQPRENVQAVWPASGDGVDDLSDIFPFAGVPPDTLLAAGAMSKNEHLKRSIFDIVPAASRFGSFARPDPPSPAPPCSPGSAPPARIGPTLARLAHPDLSCSPGTARPPGPVPPGPVPPAVRPKTAPARLQGHPERRHTANLHAGAQYPAIVEKAHAKDSAREGVGRP